METLHEILTNTSHLHLLLNHIPTTAFLVALVVFVVALINRIRNAIAEQKAAAQRSSERKKSGTGAGDGEATSRKKVARGSVSSSRVACRSQRKTPPTPRRVTTALLSRGTHGSSCGKSGSAISSRVPNQGNEAPDPP